MIALAVGILPGLLIQVVARHMRDAHLRTVVPGFDAMGSQQKLEAELAALREGTLPPLVRNLLFLGPAVSLLGGVFLLASGLGWI